MKQRLIIFTRFPEPGKAKTRLIPALGARGAARLQRDLTRHTLAQAGRLRHFCPVSLRYEGGSREKMAAAFGNGSSYREQGPGDLGCRMARAFADAFDQGFERVVIIGADCPKITPQVLCQAFDRLASCDLVLGPAADGGYYLIGLRRPAPAELARLFSGIAWGSDRVLNQTLCRAANLSLSVFRLEMLSDVDRPEDLAVWHRVWRAPSAAERISIIIPALNEEKYLRDTLRSIEGAANVETIVVDGGSRDGTAEIACQAGCRVLRSPPPRALQINAGLQRASGAIFLFLHADTRLPAHFDESIRRALNKPRVALGAFELRIDGRQPALRWIEWGVKLRSRWLRMPYGDQALFLTADALRAAGGYPILPIMDDFELVRRLRRLGRVVILPSAVTTSARRWQVLGPWRATWINQKVIAGYYFGVPPDRLAQWFRADDRPNSDRS